MLQASARLALALALLSAQRSKLFFMLFSILTHPLTFFELQTTLSKEANIVAVASARSLLDNAARVRSTAMENGYECLLAKQSDGKTAVVARDKCLCFTAASEGWLSQANHLLHNGMTTGQYLELEGAFNGNGGCV